ncbi:helix-turn-helix domain-containing protein [Helicovermis profundi]|uniref:Helix-turn-helix transcriptional regulator n=1 Tax=Helicovermis profundi TaxID=3065157 RepID=A0AAU9EKZ5_9FIRM|nr:helix-turn-helix transcriptional regulator [Clostridia bacterium S502]
MSTIGNRITILRNQHGMTQKKLANLADITEASLSRYENGLREPKISTIIKLTNVLKCTVDYLVGNTDIKDGVVISTAAIPEKLREIGAEYLSAAKELEDANIKATDVTEFIRIVKNN